MEFKEFFEICGMNVKGVSDYFDIPYRTVLGWKLGKRKCPEYLLRLMLYKLENEKKLKK